jgi:hypothetical protein
MIFNDSSRRISPGLAVAPPARLSQPAEPPRRCGRDLPPVSQARRLVPTGPARPLEPPRALDGPLSLPRPVARPRLAAVRLRLRVTGPGSGSGRCDRDTQAEGSAPSPLATCDSEAGLPGLAESRRRPSSMITGIVIIMAWHPGGAGQPAACQ